MEKIIILLISLLVVSNLYTASFKTIDRGLAKVTTNEDSCYTLRELTFNEDGYVVLGFYLNNISSCNLNVINYVKTEPAKSLRAVKNISKKKVERYFSLTVLPKTEKLIISGVDTDGETNEFIYDLVKCPR